MLLAVPAFSSFFYMRHHCVPLLMSVSLRAAVRVGMIKNV